FFVLLRSQPRTPSLFPYTTLFRSARVLWLDLRYDPALARQRGIRGSAADGPPGRRLQFELASPLWREAELERVLRARLERLQLADRKSTRLNSSHVKISYAVFCLK